MNEDMRTLIEKVDQLHGENESLRQALKDGLEENKSKTFLKGMGAGVAVTPLALWGSWKLVELAVYAAGLIEIPATIFGTVAFCMLGGLTFYLYSEVMCRRAKQFGELILNSLILDGGDE